MLGCQAREGGRRETKGRTHRFARNILGIERKQASMPIRPAYKREAEKKEEKREERFFVPSSACMSLS